MRTQEEIKKLIVGTFETQLGQECLKYLEEVFVDRDIYKQGMKLEDTAFRQGEASIVKKIIKEINNGQRAK